VARLRWFALRLLAFVRPAVAEGELAREIDAHLALLEDEYQRRGMTPDDARLAARRALGGVDQAKERHREARSFPWLEDLLRDVPYAWRSFARNPGFTIVAVLTLALGVGANTAIFTVVNAVLLKPLAYSADSGRFVRLMAHMPPGDPSTGTVRRVPVGMSASEIADLRTRTRALSHVGTVGPTVMGLSGREDAARLQGARVSASVFPLLDARPLLGRTILSDDELPGRDAVVLLSHAAWQRYFGGDSDVLGRTLVLNSVLGRRTQREYTVIGVMPPEFQFPNSVTRFWMPLAASAGGESAVLRGPLLGRLADGVTMEAAAAEIGPIVREIRRHPPEVRYELVREQDEVVAPVRPALLVLTASVGVVLLIACMNVANLLLARTAARQREVAVRAALGAGRGRLIRQVLTESVLLAALGGLAGIALAIGGVRLLRSLAATLGRFDVGSGVASVTFPRLDEVGVDPSVFAFTGVLSVLTGVLFGLAPALRSSLSDPIEAIRTGVVRAQRTGGGLVVLQIALATVLLVGGALLVRSFFNLSRVNTGYDAANVLTFQVALPVARYPDDRLRPFAEEVVSRLRSIPGVRAAAYANQLPLVALRDSAGGLWKTPSTDRKPTPGGVDARFVSRDYFAAMGIRVIAGRGFADADDAGQPRVLVINEELARRDFGGENPIGRQVYVGRDLTPWQIVGIVANVRQFGLDREPEPQFFADLRQWSGGMPLFPVGAYYAVRLDGDLDAIVSTLRGIVRQLDSEAALFNVARMETLVASTISRPRMYAVLLGIFAGVGVLLAVIGIYGVMAYAVTQRTREIGVRMALGARRGDVMSLVLRQGLALAAVGIALGLAGASAATRYLEGMLFGLTPLDRTTFAAVALLFAAVAASAAYVPARRATRVDPLTALRCE
jgi:predicted permease